ncbi:MAG: hypothetical protein ACK4UO_10945 [Pseudolabrys sp.]
MMRHARFILIAAMATIFMPLQARADTDFTGYWAQADFNNPCSNLFGFLLKADGSANADWVETKWNRAKNANEFHKGSRDGRWSAKDGRLHLAIVEVERDPKVLKLFDKTQPVTKMTNVDATVAPDGKKLNATVKAQNIEQKVFTFKCVYNRDKQ